MGFSKDRLVVGIELRLAVKDFSVLDENRIGAPLRFAVQRDGLREYAVAGSRLGHRAAHAGLLKRFILAQVTLTAGFVADIFDARLDVEEINRRWRVGVRRETSGHNEREEKDGSDHDP